MLLVKMLEWDKPTSIGTNNKVYLVNFLSVKYGTNLNVEVSLSNQVV